ncbi:MAG: hypothetical protein ACJAWC_000393 [Yoonia sp.]|jgi:hypothetical protein
MKYLFAFVVFANPAVAGCSDAELTFMSCQIEDSSKTLDVCYDDTNAYYRFGIAGQVPELALTASIADLDYRPWNGLGKDIWEEISFENGNYAYSVHGGYERPWGDETYEDVPNRNFGAVSVARYGEIFMDLDCDRSKIEFIWADDIWKIKESLGFVWVDNTREWVELPD